MKKFIILLFIIGAFLSCTSTQKLSSTQETTKEFDKRMDTLVSELCMIYGLDQGIRDREIWSALDKENIQKIDSLNFRRLVSFVEKYGYPNEKLLGEAFEAYECVELAGFAIMLHNPHQLIHDSNLFDLFLKEVHKGNLHEEAFASILDKYYWMKSRGKYVLYGSSFGTPCIETKEETNRLRAEIGLEALEDEEFKVCES